MKNCCNNADDSRQITSLAEMLRVISEPNRLRILCLLKSKPRCVCEIQKSLGLKQNLTSHHLKVLKDAGLIDLEKKGQERHYSLNKKKIAERQADFNSLFN